jgi:putative transposase
MGTGGGEGANWMSVLVGLKNRGVRDVFFLVCDGLKGLPEVVENVWPHTLVQTCIIHLIRDLFSLVPRQQWDALRKDLKLIYTAPTPDAAAIALEGRDEKWVGGTVRCQACGATRGHRSFLSWTTTSK